MGRLQLISADERFRTQTDWVDSFSSFSFGPHYDPDNVAHGRLLVSNHETVRSGTGYDPHPHRDAEIVTWVLSGSLLHEDSDGNSGIVHPGLAQRMSAGSGIVHSERNDAYRIDPTRPEVAVEFVQMWVRPNESGRAPAYQQSEFDPAELRAGFVPIASGEDPDALIALGARATFWVAVLGPGSTATVPEAPWVHLYLARGSAELEGGGLLHAGDAVRLVGSDPLRITGVLEAEVLVWGSAQ